MKTLLTFLFSFTLAYLITPLFRRMAVALKIMDLPKHRKIHKRATPLLGGVAIYLGFICALLFNFSTINWHLFLPLLIGATLLLITGIIDDIRGLSANSRLVVQLTVSFLIVFVANIHVTFLPKAWWKDIGEIIITIIWIIGVTNAFNYLDGLDGLATGSAVINLFCFSAILFRSNQYQLVILAVALMGACLGFLPYNLRKAKIFLGDAGSTLLGYILAVLAVAGYWAVDNIVGITVPILIMGVPIFDMVFTTVMRVKEKKISNIKEWLEYGAKDHFHHYLVDLGLNKFGAVLFIYAVTFSLGISAIMVSNDFSSEAYLSLAQGFLIFTIIAVLIVVGKRRRSGWGKD